MHIISKILMICSLKAGQGLDSPMEVESFNCVWHHISYCFLPLFFFPKEFEKVGTIFELFLC